MIPQKAEIRMTKIKRAMTHIFLVVCLAVKRMRLVEIIFL